MTASATTIERFCTDDVPSSERLASWNRLLSELHREHVVVAPKPGAVFRRVMLRRSYGDMAITWVESSAAMVKVQPWDAAAPDDTAVVVQDAGTTESVVASKQLRLHAGTSTLNTPQPVTLVYGETTRSILLKLPTARLAARVGDPARLVGTLAGASDAALLTSFLRTILAGEASAHEPGWDEAISDVVLDLIAITYRHRPAAPPAAPASERWQRTVREFVEHHLTDPELGASMLARRLGVSPRYVQMVFAGMATTASGYIRERRLEHAAQLLAGGRHAITDVAYQVGFADLSYFYRSFRKRYGISPKRYAAR